MTERKKYAMHWAPWLKGMGYFDFFMPLLHRNITCRLEEET